MSNKFISTWFYAGLEKSKQTVKSGLMSTKVIEKSSQRRIDFDNYAQRLEQIYTDFDQQGYDVVNVVPIAMGQSESCTQAGGAYVGDVGFSITRGAVVIGKRKE